MKAVATSPRKHKSIQPSPSGTQTPSQPHNTPQPPNPAAPYNTLLSTRLPSPILFTMSFFRRLSRDRSSKGEQDLQMPIRAAPYSSDGDNRGGSLYKDTQYPSSPTSQDKLQSYRASAPQDHLYNSSQRPPGTSSDVTTHTAPTAMAPAPDPLTKAFNDAIRPYLDQIDNLRNELDDVTLQVQQLEEERADMHAWIDKRGLRAGKPAPHFHPFPPGSAPTNLPP